jgi:hypothetical protein
MMSSDQKYSELKVYTSHRICSSLAINIRTPRVSKGNFSHASPPDGRASVTGKFAELAVFFARPQTFPGGVEP